MFTAFVMIQAEPDKIAEIARSIANMPNVAEVYSVTGDFDILVVLRKMELRGEIRGGRFASAFVGEQFALPEALDLLRGVRRAGEVDVEWDALPSWLSGDRSAAKIAS